MLPTKTLCLLLLVSLARGLSSASESWTRFIAEAETEFGEPGQRAAAFLARHRPDTDADLPPELLAENLRLAFRAREAFPWARSLDEARFHNDVLPYAVLDETRESWRPGFFDLGRKITEHCETAEQAAQALNRELFNQIGVHYNTGRKKPNQSPAESIEQGRATCTGLAIILVDACRAVGIPARVAGVANWTDKRGNHTWVEIWDGSAWRFMGADEYDANGLDRGWFVNDAGRAIEGSEEHAVWASSWAPTGRHFPLAWNPDDRSVHAVDVTRRYARGEPAPRDAGVAFLRLWNRRGGERVAAQVEAVSPGGDPIGGVTTNSGTTDLNDMPSLPLAGEGPFTLRVEAGGYQRTARVAGVGGENRTIDLYLDELALSEAEAESLVEQLAATRRGQIRKDRAAELDGKAFRIGEHTLRFLEKEFGTAPDGARSLWISLHGGGGAPAEVNDKQWQNQIRLYEPPEGIYLAPRAPTDTWNLWHQDHIDPLFDRLIETFVAARGVDPNRVYLMGYSAGGDGVFQLAPRMPDRFAAAAMMAGHPNETSPLGLRNLPFAILMGGDDAAYDRNTVARDWGARLAALRADDPEGYPHEVRIYEGLGHWMERRDAEIIPWMASQTRSCWPARVVWHQDDVTHARFYWLSLPEDQAIPRSTISAAVDGQRITISSETVSSLTLRLRDALIDLDKPIEVIANGREVFAGEVDRTLSAIERSLDERCDAPAAATALLTVRW
jgi:transglutaminase-like putative cysteine protease/predicted esterase